MSRDSERDPADSTQQRTEDGDSPQLRLAPGLEPQDERDGASQIASVLDRPSGMLALRSGRTLEVSDDGGERLTIRAPNGKVEIAIRFTDAGPILEVDASELHLRATHALVMDAETVRIRATKNLEVEIGGDIRQHIGGDALTAVDGASVLEASEVRLHAKKGDAVVSSEADTRVEGERVLLNCD